jgi:hypothetical protein
MGHLKIPPEKRKSCVFPVADKIIPFSGKRTSTLYLLNPGERCVERVHVDGCVITDAEVVRCDWAAEVDDDVSREEIFIELKGAHVEKAVGQIEETIRRLSSDPAHAKKICLIASPRSLTSREMKKQKLRFRKQYSAVFEKLKDGGSYKLDAREQDHAHSPVG